MAQQSTAALLENRVQIPAVMVHNYLLLQFKGPTALFWPSQTPGTQSTQTDIQAKHGYTMHLV